MFIVGSSEPLVGILRIGGAALLLKLRPSPAEVILGRRVIGVQAYGVLKRLQRVCQLPPARVDNAQVVVGLGVVGLDPQSLLVVR